MEAGEILAFSTFGGSGQTERQVKNGTSVTNPYIWLLNLDNICISFLHFKLSVILYIEMLKNALPSCVVASIQMNTHRDTITRLDLIFSELLVDSCWEMKKSTKVFNKVNVFQLGRACLGYMMFIWNHKPFGSMFEINLFLKLGKSHKRLN